MTTRQNEVRRILQRLNGHAPDDVAVAQMANIAEAAEIAPGDALFPLMVALEYYRVTYEKVPESIKEASAFILREHAEAFRAEAGNIAGDHKVQLEEVAKALMLASQSWLKKSLPALIHDELKTAVIDAIREPVGTATQRFERSTQVANEAAAKLRQAAHSNVMTWAAGVLVAAVLGGVAGGGLMAWTINLASPPALSQEQQDVMQWGAALQAVWPKLPVKIQEQIKNAAAGKQE